MTSPERRLLIAGGPSAPRPPSYNPFMWNACLVFLGGGTGALLRYGVGLTLAGWPGTLVVNTAGSLLLGLLVASPLAEHRGWMAFLGIGVLGGFTTWSTFNQQVVEALPGEPARAALLALGSLCGSVLAGYLGMVLGAALPR